MDMLTMDAYRAGFLQEFLSLTQQFEAAGITDSRLMRIKIDQTLQARRTSVISSRKTKTQGCNSHTTRTILCQSCGRPAIVTEVNVSRCTMVGGGYHSAIECRNAACLNIELSVLSLTELQQIK